VSRDDLLQPTNHSHPRSGVLRAFAATVPYCMAQYACPEEGGVEISLTRFDQTPKIQRPHHPVIRWERFVLCADMHTCIVCSEQRKKQPLFPDECLCYAPSWYMESDCSPLSAWNPGPVTCVEECTRRDQDEKPSLVEKSSHLSSLSHAP
jgi:hypothetical protein